MFLEIEAGLCALAVVLALTAPNLGSRWFEIIERTFGRLAQRRNLSVIVVGLTALALRAALLPVLPIPHPLMQDEFAQLLTADIFAHGRLTNLTPPLWTHFESLFIILKPTYNSKYPPAPCAFMALGQVLLGHPFWGVWLALGLMCGAICWMLQAWVGEGWALLGGFLAVVRIAAFSYWANSYWGGAVAALGGALAMGALPRLKQGNRVRNSLLMGLGLAILANSRPYEGLVFSLPIAVALFVWILGKQRPPLSISLQQVILPLCLFLGLTAAWMGYYNWRVTGNALRMPYRVYQTQYDPTPYFLWQHEKPLPEYRHAEMKQWEVYIDVSKFQGRRTLGGLLMNELEKLIPIWLFFVGPLFSLALVAAFSALPYGFSWKDISRSSKFLLLVLGTSLAGIMVEAYFYVHYSAPVTCLFLALVLLAMRRLIRWHPGGRPTGLFLVRAIVASNFLLLLIRVGATPVHLQTGFYCTPWFPVAKRTSTVGRSQILSELRRQRGQDIVLVRYSRDLYNMDLHTNDIWPPSGVWEWVYNGADIDSQRVVWAQDMGPAQDQELIDYYKDRRVWLLYADDQPPKLVPYSQAVDGQVQRPAQKER
jgi:hypothetical protein